jgi:hypothetical protein
MFRFGLFLVYNLIVAGIIWVQSVAPVTFPVTLKKYPILFYGLSLVAGFFFIEGSKIGFSYFSSAWTIRFIGFALNTIMFALLTYFILSEGLQTKDLISIVLAILILVVQFTFSK